MTKPLERAFGEAAGPDPGYCTTCQGPMPCREVPAQVVIEVVGAERPESTEEPSCPACGRPVDRAGKSVLAFSRESGVQRRPRIIVEVRPEGFRRTTP